MDDRSIPSENRPAAATGGITQQLRRRADNWLDRPALECEGRITSYRATFAQADAVARRLVRDGVATGERVGYLGKNSDRYFVLLLGIAAAGAVATPIGWRLTPAEILFIVDDARMTRLFVAPEFEAVAAALSEARPTLRLVSTDRRTTTLAGFDDWKATADVAIDPPEVDAAAPFVQLYTSGTTGRPKGVVVSHAAWFALRPEGDRADRPWDRWPADEVSVVAMPVAHVSGTNWGLVALYNGAKVLVMPEFDVAGLLEAIDRRNVTKVFLVPSALGMVLRHPQAAATDFAQLRYLHYGSSPIPLPLLREAIDVMGCGFVQHYGMTETTGTVVTLGPEDHDAAGSERMRSAGRAEPGVTLRIVDADLREAPLGTIGEVLIHTANAFTHYWNRPDADAETLVDGWVRTGDAGYLDADGYLFIQDRLKDMIITGGENVYPAEVESLLHEHPAIAEVAVIGVPDDRWGEAVTAVIVPSDNAPPFDEAAVIAWARTRLAAYKTPKRIVVADRLPRNASGKILRRELRAPFWQNRDRQVA